MADHPDRRTLPPDSEERARSRERDRPLWSILSHHPVRAGAYGIFFIVMFTGGMRWWTRPSIFLTVDGTTRRIRHRGLTVADVLKIQHVTVGPQDLVVPPPATPVQRNTQITVTRVKRVVETEEQKLPPRITWRIYLKANLRPVRVERGQVTSTRRTVERVLHDGVSVSERVLKRRVKHTPVWTLTLFHKKDNLPEKTYDLLKLQKIPMLATAYYVGDPMVPSDTVFLGYKLRRGFVAVDPKVIPLRTRLYVPGYGYAYAADTGSAIKGNRIDLAVQDKKEEARFNHRHVTVYILEKAKTW